MSCLEVWKRFNDFLEVSNFGNVKSHKKIINGEVCKNGYKRIHVSNNGTQYKYLVHRLVAETFIENPLNKPQVNHIDGNKQNNKVENLEWVTCSENNKHAYKTNLKSAKGENNGFCKLTEKQVLEIRSLYEKGKHNGYNANELAKKYNVSSKTILNIINKKIWKHI